MISQAHDSKKKLLVSVVMLTYNHEDYISQAIESIVNQKCDFKFELVIGEDASTDNTRKIIETYIKKYPNIIKPIYTKGKNIGPQDNFLRCIETAKGMYIALCEGDDYWTDTNKLQKQIDFLENNPDYGMVHGDVNILNQETGKISIAHNKTNRIEIPSGHILEYLILPSHSIKTMTTCFRKDILQKYYIDDNEIMSKHWRSIDISVWLVLARHSKIKYFNEVLATYRLLPESMSRSKDTKKLHEFHKKIHEIRAYFASRYNMSNHIKLSLQKRKYKTDIFDAIAMNDKELKKKSLKEYKSLEGKFNLKERLKIIFFDLK
jgi:glycosyltransferase involved in cell wall biosynthesis